MSAENYMSEAEYMYMNEDHTIDYYDEVLKATNYNAAGRSMLHLKGSEMVGRNCPTCGGRLVKRVNGRDGRSFVACDKKKRRRCPFTISMNETLYERSTRIERKLSV